MSTRHPTLRLTIWILVWLIFFTKSIWKLDPDFGQHLKTGELIVRSGIPTTDPFSYTMPSWKYINHAWLSDVLIYLGYQFAGTTLLAALFSTLALLSLLLLTPRSSWTPLTVFLAAATLVGRVGIREQIIDWVVLALILKILFHPPYWQRFKWLLPLITLCWTNLHGGVILGIAVLAIGLFGFAVEKTLSPSDLIVLAVSLLTTLITPYGPDTWKQVYLEITDHRLRSIIAEWQPGYTEADFGFWMFATLIAVFSYLYPRALSLPEKLITFALFSSGLLSLRNMAFFSLIASHSSGKLLSFFESHTRTNPQSTLRSHRFTALLTGVGFTIFLVHSPIELRRALNLRESNYYPTLAVDWLHSHPISGNLFSEYGWGSYLIWRLPQHKTFIDGRMPSWKWHSPIGESNSALEDYFDIVYRGIDFVPIFEKYHITTVLWPKHFSRDLFTARDPTTRRPTSFPLLPLPSRLVQAGWRITYEDNLSTILTHTPIP